MTRRQIKMKKLYFIVGSQDLYGEECLKQVAEDSRQMVAFLNEKVGDLAEIELLPTVETSEIHVDLIIRKFLICLCM